MSERRSVGESECRSAKREARGPERRRVRGSEGPPAGSLGHPLLILEGAPQKRKVPCSLMFLAHFEVPCLSGMIFATFNLRWELLLFRATFLTQNATLPGGRWKNL